MSTYPYIIPLYVIECFIPYDRSYVLYTFRLGSNLIYNSSYVDVIKFDIHVSPIPGRSKILSSIKGPYVECFIDLRNNSIILTKSRIIIKRFSVCNIKYSSNNMIGYYSYDFYNYDDEFKFLVINDLLAKKKKIKSIISILLKYKKQPKKGFISLVKTSFSTILLGYFKTIYKR